MSKLTLHTLKYNLGSIKNRKRVGRGHGSGHGETSCKGNNGHKQRSGYRHKWGFEGGQTPIYKRTPMIHIINNFAIKMRTVTLDMLQPILKSGIVKINQDVLSKFRIIKKKDIYKIVCGKNNNDLKDIEVYADGFSKKAKELIEASRGKCYINKQVKKENKNAK